jgi:hypothetical protein
MPNPIKYSTGSETLALKKGNFYIGTGDVGKGPTSSTGYYNGITPPSGGYTIYLNKETGGPSIYTVTNDTQLISLTNSIAGQSYTTANECLSYFVTQTDKLCVNRNYEGIITNGLVLNVDAGFTASYPKNGTTWYNIIGTNNTSLINGVGFTTSDGGAMTFDGVNDFVTCGNYQASNTNCSVSIWAKSNDSPSGTRYPFAWANSGPFISQNNIAVLSGGVGIAVICRDVDSRTVQVNSTNFTFNNNVWHNIVLVRDVGNVYLYINGTLNNSGVVSGSFGSFDNVPLNIGVHPGLSSTVFPGNIAQVLVYNNFSLSSTQVLNNYNATKSRFGL